MAIFATIRFGPVASNNTPRFGLGGDVTVWVDYRDTLTKALTAVSGVTFTVVKADGTVAASPSVTTVAAGTYRAVITPDQAGTWAVSVDSSTSGTQTRTRSFVMASDLPAPNFVGPTAVLQVAGQPGPTVALDGSDIAFEPGVTSAVSRTAGAKMRDVISILDYGVTLDGTLADSNRIIAACQAAAADGRVLFFPKGQYRLHSTPVITGAAGFAFVANAGEAIITRSPADGTHFFTFQDCNRFSVTGLTFDGPLGSGSQSNQSMTYVFNSYNWRFSGCRWNIAGGLGVEFGSSRGVVTDCAFTGTLTAMYLGQGGAPKDPTRPLSEHIVFANNLIVGTTAEALDFNYRFKNIVVASNVFVDCGRVDHQVMDIGGGLCGDCIITNNVIDQRGLTYPVVTWQCISVKTSNGGQADNCIVSANRIIGPDEIDELSVGISTDADGVHITGNIIDGFFYSIRLAGDEHNVTSNRCVGAGGAGIYNANGNRSIISANTLDCPTASTAALLVLNVSGMVASDNLCIGGTGRSISSSNATDCRYSGNRLSGGLALFTGARNHIAGNIIELITIDLRSTDTVVDGNTMTGAGGNGLSVNSAASDAIIVNNIVTGYNVGISLNAPRCHVAGNRCTNATAGGNSVGINVLAGATGSSIALNHCSDFQSSPTQARGINIVSGVDFLAVLDNVCRGNTIEAIGGLSTVGVNSVVRLLANATSGGGSVAVGLASLAVPRNAELGGAAYWDADGLRGAWPAARGAAYQITAEDYGRTLIAESGTLTWTLPALSTLRPGWWVRVFNRSGATLTIQRRGADVIGSAATSLTVADGAGAALGYRDGTRFERIG